MHTWIALIRGINVGGKNILPMAQLRSDLESLELHQVRTYIQSGNVVFSTVAKTTAAALERKLRGKIKDQHSFVAQVLILSHDQLSKAIEANPFSQLPADPKFLHFFFLDRQPATANVARLVAVQAATEKFELINQVLYLYAPAGIGRSRLAASLEKFLELTATARNLRTVQQLAALAEA